MKHTYKNMSFDCGCTNEIDHKQHDICTPPSPHSFEKLKTHLSVIIIFMHSLFFSQGRVIGFEFLFSQNRLSILASHVLPAKDSLECFANPHVRQWPPHGGFLA